LSGQPSVPSAQCTRTFVNPSCASRSVAVVASDSMRSTVSTSRAIFARIAAA
jgi:hypothetical protein